MMTLMPFARIRPRVRHGFLLLLLATLGCSDAIPDPDVTPQPPPVPEPECALNERWDENADACVCVDGYALESGECALQVDAKACLLISSTDWGTSGSLSILDVETGEVLDDVVTYHQDSVIRTFGSDVYVLQRMYGDAVLKLDPDNHYTDIWEESVRLPDLAAPNPTDMVRHGNHFYIALYNDGRIVQANVNPIGGGFLTGLQTRITPPSWDGTSSELKRVQIVDGTLFALTEGLGDDWSCGGAGSPNRGRIYAFDPETLTPKGVFAGGAEFHELAFCNATGWESLADGRTVVHMLGGYKAFGATENDGGVEVIDLRHPTEPSVVTLREGDLNNDDIFGLHTFHDDVYISFYPNTMLPIRIYKLNTESDTWTLESPLLYEGSVWGMQAVGDELFIAERDFNAEHVVRINRHTGESTGAPIETSIAPETLTLYHRADRCW